MTLREPAGDLPENASAPTTEVTEAGGEQHDDQIVRQEPVEPQPDEAVAFLERWRPGGPWILGALVEGRMQCAEFTSLDDAKNWIAEKQAQRHNVYHQPNDCRLGPNGKPRKADVLRARCIQVDIDAKAGDPLDKALNDIDQKIRAAVGDTLPTPTVDIATGGGRQLLWRIPPVEFSSDAEREDFEQFNVQVKMLLGGDDCHAVCQPMRLPGTVNFPHADKVAKNPGRCDALAHIVAATWETHSLDQFLKAPPVKGVSSSSRGGAAALPGSGELKVVEFDLEQFFDKMQPAVQFLITDGCEVKVLKDILHRALLGDVPGQKIHEWIAANSRNEAQHFATIEMLRAGMTPDQVFSVLIDDRYGISRAIKTKGGKARPQWKRYAKKRVGDAWAEIEQPDDEFHVNEKGEYLPSPHNFRLAVKKMGGELRFNKFAGKVEIHGIPDHGPLMQDRTLEHLAIHIEERFGLVCRMERLKVILNEAADRNSYNPVLDYFESLAWDGAARLDRWLIDYGSAQDDAEGYVRAVSPLPLLAAVKRQYEPGAKFDELLTLISDQGFEKSSALRVLALREEWFCEDLALDSDPKVVIEQTRGKLIVEIAELKGQRASPMKVKAFLSKQKDQARGAWGRYTEEVLRQWVPFGTTNESDFLEDATGNRRHWPVGVGRFDLERLRADRDQLWAEAVARVKAGESIRLDRKYWGVAKQHQDERRGECAIRERLETILDPYDDHFVETEALWWALDVKSATEQSRACKRLADAMRVLGWTKPKNRIFIEGRRRSGWLKGKGTKLLGVGSLSGRVAEVDEERAE